MKKIDGYWVDENNNSWHAKNRTEEQAVKYSESLVDCINCVDCTNCRGCIGCTNCIKCVGCVDCRDCKECVDCRYRENEVNMIDNIA